jgi:prevent-host-death family protein
MRAVNIHEAKTHLSRLVERAAAGEVIIIARSGKPIAMLVAYEGDDSPRMPGSLRGRIEVPDDFDAPLPSDIAQVRAEDLSLMTGDAIMQRYAVRLIRCDVDASGSGG